jgi:periplasmic protein TonB
MNCFRTVACPIVLLAMVAVNGFAQGEAKKLSRSEALAAVLSKVQPEYPAIAKQLKVHGVADLEAVVSEDGTVEKVNIVSGNPILTKPAADALKKWKFKPISSDGKPSKALAPVSFAFDL